MQRCGAYARLALEKSPLSIATGQGEHIVLRVSTLNGWNRARNMSLGIPGRVISNHLFRAVTLSYLWAHMQWRVLLMACFAIQFLRKPGITPGLMTRWWAKAGFWQQLRVVGMCPRSSFPVTKQPAGRYAPCLVMRS